MISLIIYSSSHAQNSLKEETEYGGKGMDGLSGGMNAPNSFGSVRFPVIERRVENKENKSRKE